MPNQHAIDKVCIGTWVPRTLRQRLLKKAKEAQMRIGPYLEHLYTDATRDIELTPEDYREIAKQIEEAQRGVDRRTRASRAKSKAG
jgi:hypothetical protein